MSCAASHWAPRLLGVAIVLRLLSAPFPALAGVATPSEPVPATITGTPTRTPTVPTATRTQTGTRTATPTRTDTRTITPSRTRTPVSTRTQTPSVTPTATLTFTMTPPFTRTQTGTRTSTATRTSSPPPSPTRTDRPTATTTGTRTAVPTRTATPPSTATGTVTGSPTELPASISVDLIAERRGNNNDGTFTTVVSALVADLRGNPAGDGVVVVFTLSQPLPGVTITQNGRVNQPPDCDISSYVAENGPVNPRPGTALSCLQYVRSREGDSITISARAIGIGGVILGQRTVQLPPSPPPSATATDSPSPTPTIGSPTMTGTATETRTVTETPTSGPSATVTETPTAPIRVAVIGGSARPGSAGTFRFDLADRDAVVHGLSFDILIDLPAFDVFEINMQCRTDPGLTTHQLSVSLAFDPFVPAGKRRFRFVLFDFIGEDDSIRPGPMVTCSLPVSATAPLGPSQLILDRVLAGDIEGQLIPGVLPVNGELNIDPEAPLPTSTGTRTNTPTITPTRTLTATRTATFTPTVTTTATAVPTATASPTHTETATPTQTPVPTETPTETPVATPTDTATATPSVSPTPSPTQPLCIGDCDGGSAVSINELILAVNISLGSSQPSACLAIDRDGSGAVSIDELIAAVGNALTGC